MPPEGEARPSAEEVKRIVSILTNTLNKFRENSNADPEMLFSDDSTVLNIGTPFETYLL